MFGKTATEVFQRHALADRAAEAWEGSENERLTLHQCRHSFASLMIAAGANAKALSSYMGHATAAFTYDTYGHLMPGNEAEAVGLLDSYLAAAAS